MQAGTGTGKSLGYLVPALLHRRRVVVATATLALQHQLVERDLPALVAGAREQLGDRIGEVPYAVLKGRSNYACLHRVREGTPDDTGVLVEVPEGTLGGEVVRLRSWAEEQAGDGGLGDRDSAPTHTDRGWAQVSVSARECLGAQRCPYGGECFAEQARETAHAAQVVVTNHALLAIHAIDGVPMLPEHDAVVVDEGHELVARVTQASTDELSPFVVDRASRRVRSAGGAEASVPAEDLADAGEALREALDGLPGGRLDQVPEAVADALGARTRAPRASASPHWAVARTRRPRATPTRSGSRPRRLPTRCARSPSGSRPAASTTCAGCRSGTAAGAATSCGSRRWTCRCRCGTSCSAPPPW